MSAHTPGPWAYSEAARTGIATVASVEHWVIGPDYGWPEMAIYDNHGPAEADARLIAAAPELLAALEAMLEQFTKSPSTLKDSEARIKAHAAIAKATGAA